MTWCGPVRPALVLNQVVLPHPVEMREAGVKGLRLRKNIPSKQLTLLVSQATNIQALAGVMLSFGEMAVGHFDRSGQLVVDGRISVP